MQTSNSQTQQDENGRVVTADRARAVLILGVGNVLMGDEGVGVHVIGHLADMDLPQGVECLDGGTGSFLLLEPMQQARRVVMVDATMDGLPPGTLRRLRPRFSKDYPRTLTAHDIGLKDLLDAFYMLEGAPDIVLFAVSIAPLQEMSTELSPEIAARVPEIAAAVLRESRQAGGSRVLADDRCA